VPRPRLRTPRLEAGLLDAALGLLEEAGPGAVTARAVAARAGTSAPALYELFGDKAGLVRALFFEGFARLLAHFERLGETDDPVADLHAAVGAFRRFAVDHPGLFRVMYAEPFEVFSPDSGERALGDGTRAFLVDRVRRCVAAGRLAGEPKDLAHGLLALAQGLASQEIAGWLGRSEADRDRRWSLAVDALVDGFRARP
jgi:AcrR family transcriptional regulator